MLRPRHRVYSDIELHPSFDSFRHESSHNRVDASTLEDLPISFSLLTKTLGFIIFLHLRRVSFTDQYVNLSQRYTPRQDVFSRYASMAACLVYSASSTDPRIDLVLLSSHADGHGDVTLHLFLRLSVYDCPLHPSSA